MLIAFSQVLITISSMGTIRMFGVMPMPHYLIFPGSASGALIITLVLLPRASYLHDQSVKLLQSWGKVASRGAVMEKSLFYKRNLVEYRACCKAISSLRPYQIYASVAGAKLFMAKRSTKATFFNCCADATISGLMSFPAED